MSGTVSVDLWLDMFNALYSRFLCGGCSKGILKSRNTPDPCCVRQISISTVKGQRFCLQDPPLACLFKISCKYKESGPLNPLNKYNGEPDTNMQTIWNERSVCVFSSRFILGCSCVCGLPTTNSKTSAASH